MKIILSIYKVVSQVLSSENLKVDTLIIKDIKNQDEKRVEYVINGISYDDVGKKLIILLKNDATIIFTFENDGIFQGSKIVNETTWEEEIEKFEIKDEDLPNMCKNTVVEGKKSRMKLKKIENEFLIFFEDGKEKTAILKYLDEVSECTEGTTFWDLVIIISSIMLVHCLWELNEIIIKSNCPNN